MKEYKKRVADQILSDKLESSGTVLISSVSCFRPSRFQPTDSSLDGEISIRIILFFNGRYWRFSYGGARCTRP